MSNYQERLKTFTDMVIQPMAHFGCLVNGSVFYSSKGKFVVREVLWKTFPHCESPYAYKVQSAKETDQSKYSVITIEEMEQAEREGRIWYVND